MLYGPGHIPPPLTSPTPLADAGVAPSVQAKVLTALHDRRVETKDIQKAASHQSGGKPQYDAQELLEKVGCAYVVECTLVHNRQISVPFALGVFQGRQYDA